MRKQKQVFLRKRTKEESYDQADRIIIINTQMAEPMRTRYAMWRILIPRN